MLRRFLIHFLIATMLVACEFGAPEGTAGGAADDPDLGVSTQAVINQLPYTPLSAGNGAALQLNTPLRVAGARFFNSGISHPVSSLTLRVATSKTQIGDQHCCTTPQYYLVNGVGGVVPGVTKTFSGPPPMPGLPGIQCTAGQDRAGAAACYELRFDFAPGWETAGGGELQLFAVFVSGNGLATGDWVSVRIKGMTTTDGVPAVSTIQTPVSVLLTAP